MFALLPPDRPVGDAQSVSAWLKPKVIDLQTRYREPVPEPPSSKLLTSNHSSKEAPIVGHTGSSGAVPGKSEPSRHGWCGTDHINLALVRRLTGADGNASKQR